MDGLQNSKRDRLWRESMQKYGICLVLLAMIVIMSIVSPTFRTFGNSINILQQVSSDGIMAIGMLFVMIAGGIDLSIGSIIALTSVVLGQMLTNITPGNIVMAILVAVAISALFGALNGFLVAKFNMFPFVVTLATQLVIRGVAYLLGSGASVTLASKQFRAIGTGRAWGSVPYPVIIFAVTLVIAYFLLHKTKFGRYIYAVGGNPQAAISSGINIFSVRMLSFVIMGVCAGVAGVTITSRISAAQPNIGIGYETDVIAACVIGGTSFSGGIGTVFGSLIGVLMIGVIYNSMNLLQVSSYWQQIMKGTLIVAAVLLDMFIHKTRNK